MRQEIYHGIIVGVDLIDLKQDYSPDCSNVDISIRGEMSSILGSEKVVTTGFASSIDAVHQLKSNEYVVEGGRVQKI